MSPRPEKIILPYNFTPRTYQAPMFNFFPQKFKRAVCIWHRKSGKDVSIFNILVRESQKKVGVYYYFFPTYTQAKKVIWDGINDNGQKFLDYIPKTLIRRENATELLVEMTNNSIIQLIGTDSFDSIRGPNPIGCIFSEYSYQNPRAFDIVAPILAQNNGWALFNYTPNGPNHGQDLYEMAKKDPEWFCQLLTVDDTKRPDGTPVITPEAVERARKDGMPDNMILQEFWCSFTAAIQGSYFGEEINWLRTNQRITKVPHDPNQYVDTWWDIGVGDPAAIWFTQDAPDGIHVIDCHDVLGAGLGQWAQILLEKSDELGYTYGRHVAPHDMGVREVGTNATARIDIARLDYGIFYELVKRPLDKLNLSIEPARKFLKRCWFDAEKCSRGIKALELYHRQYDTENKILSIHPAKDWTVHLSDAFQTLAIGHDQAAYQVRGGMQKVRRMFG